MAQGRYGSCVEHHRIAIHDRGGARRAYNLTDIAAVQWERIRDTKSSAQFTISGRSCEAQADTIREIAGSTGRYELVIFREEERVWEGPLLTASTLRDKATFLAADVKHYLDKTSLTKDWLTDPDAPVLMGDRIEDMVTWELSEPYTMETAGGSVVVQRWENLSPPIDVLPYMLIHPGTVMTNASTLAFQMMLGEHIDSLVDGGMDFTVVGRRIVFWDSALSIGQTRRVTDADFLGDIEVIRRGSDHWSISHVSPGQGDPEDDERYVGHAGGNDPYYGAWENIVSQASEQSEDGPDQDALNSQAERDLLHRNPAPLEVRVPDGVGIRLSHDLTIQHLIPGVIMPVVTAKNIQRVTQPQRLDKVTVNESSSGETVQVSLSPFGDAGLVGA